MYCEHLIWHYYSMKTHQIFDQYKTLINCVKPENNSRCNINGN